MEASAVVDVEGRCPSASAFSPSPPPSATSARRMFSSTPSSGSERAATGARSSRESGSNDATITPAPREVVGGEPDSRTTSEEELSW